MEMINVIRNCIFIQMLLWSEDIFIKDSVNTDIGRHGMILALILIFIYSKYLCILSPLMQGLSS